MRRWLLIVAVLSFGCSKGKAEEKKPEKEATKADAAAHADEAEHEALPKRVKLTKEVIADAKIQSAPAVKEILAATLSLPGEIAADPDKSARISTPVAGRLVDVRFKEGSEVKKGDALATVRVPEIGKVRSAFNATTGKAAAARANAERLQGLLAKGFASKQEALSATAEADALEAEARALSEQLRGLGMSAGGNGAEVVLRSPVSGVVISRNAVVGQPVPEAETLASIADVSEVWFLGRVFEKDLGRVHLGAKAELQLNAYPKERFEGQIEYVSRQIDPVARTVTARIRLKNRGDLLRIGLFGTALVATGEDGNKSPSIVVPRSAIAEIGGKPVVFVRHADDDFELHDVVLGDAALGKIEVLNGLREGEQVVTEGVFTLKSIVLKSTLAEEE